MARAVPPHGTETRYTNHRCRCAPCRKAACEGRAARHRRAAHHAWGGPPTAVDADVVRAHVRMLVAAGLTSVRITELARIGDGVLRNVLYGTGGRPPARTVRWANAQAILSVQPSMDALPDSARIDGSGTRRRLQALMALGWSSLDISERTGYSRAHVTVLSEASQVKVSTARKVRGVYAELSMRIPPPSVASQRAKLLARRKGWQPPLAWDDDLIDLSEEDLAAELRRQAGLMSSAELARARRAYREQGDTTPLTVEATREYKRRQRQQRSELGEAS